jgi:hypothetical protein
VAQALQGREQLGDLGSGGAGESAARSSVPAGLARAARSAWRPARRASCLRLGEEPAAETGDRGAQHHGEADPAIHIPPQVLGQGDELGRFGLDGAKQVGEGGSGQQADVLGEQVEQAADEDGVGLGVGAGGVGLPKSEQGAAFGESEVPGGRSSRTGPRRVGIEGVETGMLRRG